MKFKLELKLNDFKRNYTILKNFSISIKVFLKICQQSNLKAMNSHEKKQQLIASLHNVIVHTLMIFQSFVLYSIYDKGLLWCAWKLSQSIALLSSSSLYIPFLFASHASNLQMFQRPEPIKSFILVKSSTWSKVDWNHPLKKFSLDIMSSCGKCIIIEIYFYSNANCCEDKSLTQSKNAFIILLRWGFLFER